MLKFFSRNTRECSCFKTDHYERTLYKRSPYLMGTKLIDLPDIYTFKARLKRQNKVYVDLLT